MISSHQSTIPLSMLIKFYLLECFLVFALSIRPFFNDSEVAKKPLANLALLIIFMVFSPVTLPSMLLTRLFRSGK